MRKESLFHKIFIRILKKLGIIETHRISSKEMCERASTSNICPHDCERCAWGRDYD